jgi:maltooligosyltrehalose trehalohydrolase
VSYAQNHDQAGNRPFGERLSHLVPPSCSRLWAAIYLLSPQIPMLFMGEEWGAQQPFLYFSDVGEDLADAIRQGREKEMESFPRKEGQGAPPNPMAEDTFRACKLDWSQRDEEESARFLAVYRRLIALRKKEIVPRLHGMSGNSGRYELLGNRTLRVTWTLGDGAELSLVANLSPEPYNGINVWGSDHLWLEGFATGETLEAWSVVFTLKPAA